MSSCIVFCNCNGVKKLICTRGKSDADKNKKNKENKKNEQGNKWTYVGIKWIKKI